MALLCSDAGYFLSANHYPSILANSSLILTMGPALIEILGLESIFVTSLQVKEGRFDLDNLSGISGQICLIG
jgi:hypothetical protein